MSVILMPGHLSSRRSVSGATHCTDNFACAASVPVNGRWLRFSRWLAVLLVVCCTLTPWLQQLHASEHLTTPVDEISCQICQHGSLTDALSSPHLIAAVSLLLFVLLAAALPSLTFRRRFVAFSSRAPPLMPVNQ